MLKKHAGVAVVLVLVLVLVALSCGKDNPETPNTAPTASFTVSPASGTIDTVFHFDASGSSDAQDAVSTLQVRWDWENDGTWDTDWSATKTASHQYGTIGTETIRLSVKDTEGLTDDTTRAVTVSTPFEVPDMVLLPAGTFTMGDGMFCGVEHQVTLTNDFDLGQYEVTNQEYLDAVQWAYDHEYVTVTTSSVLDNLDGSTVVLVNLASSSCEIQFVAGQFSLRDGGHGINPSHPMKWVTWYGAVAYCDWLSMMEGYQRAYNHQTWECSEGNPYVAVGYRLPTDAEWEYAAQYNDERIYPWGNEEPSCVLANYNSCVGWTTPVGSHPAEKTVDGKGLFDMAGNVLEWCSDRYNCDLGTTPAVDPVGPSTGSQRLFRGGSYGAGLQQEMRCSWRSTDWGRDPGETFADAGFRCARTQQ
jgi:formylglycine-generating enzyme required for sulfatase activity